MVLRACKELAKDIAGDKWTLVYLRELSTDNFWYWENSDGLEDNRDAYLGLYKCVDFNKELWFELGKCMWRKYHSVFPNHLK